MPIFDYKCEYCGSIKEVIVHKSDIQEPICAECEQKMVKLPSSPGLLRTNFHDKPSVKVKNSP